MKNNHSGYLTPRIGVLVIFLAAAAAGCTLANTLPPSAVSIFSAGAPVLYRNSPSGELARSSVDRSREGIVVSASLDELVLPAFWAKAEGTSSYTLFNLAVDPAGADAGAFISAGGAYYAKYLQIGSGEDAKIFTAAPSAGIPVWTHVTGDTAITLNSSLGESDRKWYWEQMTSGSYLVLDAAQNPMAGVDYTMLSTGAPAFNGVTKANRWLKSYRDASWKTGRDALTEFVTGKILVGTESLPMEERSGRWFLGVDDTAVPSDWDLSAYFGLLMESYEAEGSAVDVVTSPSS